MKTILVTGAAGFIGSHLCEELLKKGNKVIGMDNFCTSSKKNIERFFENKNFSFLEQDITEAIEIGERVSQVYNLASPASPISYLKIPVETLLAGSVGIKNVLDFALKNKVTFLQSSTSEVYGDPLEHPQRETYFGNVNSIGPRSCYDESKRFAEAMVMAYHRACKADTRIVRIFNTYGPRMQKEDGRIISTFVVQALENKPITVFGSGEQTRSFCFVTDLVEGLQKAMGCNYSLPINLGNPDEHTVLDIAERIIKMTGSKSKIVFRELPQDDPTKRKPDISLAKKLLKWEPKVPLEKGLKETIERFREN